MVNEPEVFVQKEGVVHLCLAVVRAYEAPPHRAPYDQVHRGTPVWVTGQQRQLRGNTSSLWVRIADKGNCEGVFFAFGFVLWVGSDGGVPKGSKEMWWVT